MARLPRLVLPGISSHGDRGQNGAPAAAAETRAQAERDGDGVVGNSGVIARVTVIRGGDRDKDGTQAAAAETGAEAAGEAGGWTI